MGKLDGVLYCLGVLALVAALLLARTRPPTLDETQGRWARAGGWLWEKVNPEPEPDPAAEDLRRVMRRERLRSDILRLQRIIDHDIHMSATRQIANRLAYQWLLRELDVLRGSAARISLANGLGGESSRPSTTASDWLSAPPSEWQPEPSSDWLSAPPSQWSSPDPQYRPKVEVLEIGWRR
jgi:hypothetical protein